MAVLFSKVFCSKGKLIFLVFPNFLHKLMLISSGILNQQKKCDEKRSFLGSIKPYITQCEYCPLQKIPSDNCTCTACKQGELKTIWHNIKKNNKDWQLFYLVNECYWSICTGSAISSAVMNVRKTAIFFMFVSRISHPNGSFSQLLKVRNRK